MTETRHKIDLTEMEKNKKKQKKQKKRKKKQKKNNFWGPDSVCPRRGPGHLSCDRWQERYQQIFNFVDIRCLWNLLSSNRTGAFVSKAPVSIEDCGFQMQLVLNTVDFPTLNFSRNLKQRSSDENHEIDERLRLIVHTKVGEQFKLLKSNGIENRLYFN